MKVLIENTYLSPNHTYLNIFENGDFFSPFSENYAFTRSVFESFSPVHLKTLKRWKYDSNPHRACVMLVVHQYIMYV